MWFNRIISFVLIVLCFSCSNSTPPEFDVDPNFIRGEFYDEWTYQVFPTATDGFTTALFRLWVPENVNPRAILVMSPGSNSTSLGEVNLKEWQDFAKKEKLALMGLQLQGGNYAASTTSIDALFLSLKEIASKHNISKVFDLPFLVSGFSAGGNFSYFFSLERKNKTIAFANIKGFSAEVSTGIKTVPGLFITGELEGGLRIEAIRKSFISHRKNKNVTCFAIEPNSGHSIDNSNTLVRAFFSSILKKRLINEELVDLKEDDVLLASLDNLETYSFANYPYNKEEAVCIIDDDFKNIWVQFLN